MEENKKIPYDIDIILNTFNLEKERNCTHLQEWLSAEYPLSDIDNYIISELHEEMLSSGDYLNEEELKIRFIGSLFLIAKIDVKKKIRVFYERPLSATVDSYHLSVICDCMIATPIGINTPNVPYFFLQEFKKGKGEKNDPEAQMLMAMLIAQQKNEDKKPLYGGFLIGTDWQFATLIQKQYCLSRKFDTTKRTDIEQIVFLIRKLKELIMVRG
jgi:hypothetical protein